MFQYNSCYCSIEREANQGVKLVCFNTTLVTVLYFDNSTQNRTSYVSIQLLLLFYGFHSSMFPSKLMFQYNSCYCSIYWINPGFWCCICVSIQLLLLFYKLLGWFCCCCCCVSIQLLLLFYFGFWFDRSSKCCVSIQLLLLFYYTRNNVKVHGNNVSIQLLLLFYIYNMCRKNAFTRFNTTLVTVLCSG